MSTYEKSLILLYELLTQVGAQGWAEQALSWTVDWQQNKRVSLPHYGGWGSLLDLVLCEENHHNVTKEQGAWANTLLFDLYAICSKSGERPEVDFSEEDLNREVILRLKRPRLLSGDRCLDCGYAEVTGYDIHQVLAFELLPGILFPAVSSPLDRDVIRRILSFDVEGLLLKYQALSNQILKSGIAVTNRKGWLRPCPRCSSNNTAVYRWHENEKGLFEPSSDNLPLNKKR